MSGVTDVAFRTLSKKYGAGLTYTEFVSSAALVRGSKKSLEMIQTDKTEKPVAVQLFGNSIEEVVEAAKLVQNKFDIIDVNCGCPAWKVIKTGAGSDLLKDPKKISKFVNKLVSSVQKPITVKIRTGIDDKNINALKVAKVIEDSGASAIAIHGRTQKQGYSGKADWDIIKKVKESVNIPIIGNGDVFTPEDFKKKIEFSNVDYIMIARGAIGNPYIFRQINDYLKKGSYSQPDKIKLFLEYLELANKYNLSPFIIKSQAVNFTKGLEGSTKLRNEIMKLNSIEEFKGTIINNSKIYPLKK